MRGLNIHVVPLHQVECNLIFFSFFQNHELALEVFYCTISFFLFRSIYRPHTVTVQDLSRSVTKSFSERSGGEPLTQLTPA